MNQGWWLEDRLTRLVGNGEGSSFWHDQWLKRGDLAIGFVDFMSWHL